MAVQLKRYSGAALERYLKLTQVLTSAGRATLFTEEKASPFDLKTSVTLQTFSNMLEIGRY